VCVCGVEPRCVYAELNHGVCKKSRTTVCVCGVAHSRNAVSVYGIAGGKYSHTTGNGHGSDQPCFKVQAGGYRIITVWRHVSIKCKLHIRKPDVESYRFEYK
jgi:hypothetical protein